METPLQIQFGDALCFFPLEIKTFGHVLSVRPHMARTSMDSIQITGRNTSTKYSISLINPASRCNGAIGEIQSRAPPSENSRGPQLIPPIHVGVASPENHKMRRRLWGSETTRAIQTRSENAPSTNRGQVPGSSTISRMNCIASQKACRFSRSLHLIRTKLRPA